MIKTNSIIKTIMMVLIFSFMLSTTACANTNAEEFPKNANPIVIYIDGEELVIPEGYGTPMIDNKNRLQVPVRIVSMGLNKTVEWIEKESTVIIDEHIKVKIGSTIIETKNGNISVDSPAFKIKGENRVYVPIRFISDALGYKTEYKKIAGINCIYITTTQSDGNTNTDINENKNKNLFSNNEELVNFFKSNFREEQYIIEDSIIHFGNREASFNGEITAFYYAEFEDMKEYYEIIIKNFQNDNRTAVKQILSTINKDLGNHIFDELTYAWDYDNTAVVENEWISYGNMEYYYNTRVQGVNVLIRDK